MITLGSIVTILSARIGLIFMFAILEKKPTR
jgi:hypothetical protein